MAIRHMVNGAVAGAGGGTSYVHTVVGTGDGSTTTFSLSSAGVDVLTVLVDAIPQLPSTWSVAGTTLTLSDPPANGSSVEVFAR